ncbi:hypothetical protein [Neptunicella sp. SCSIO 80796]|uniref:hypothetical protein n=1 Tax=Neptunicella plasticusilytica TaxID=3117012 RepID=UPI003A4D2C6A
MAPFIAALLSAGPALIRLFGQSKGGKTEAVAETIAGTVEAIQGKPTDQQSTKLQALIDSLDPAEVNQIRLGLAQVEAEREKARLEHDTAMHTQQQLTIRESKDIKGVRPEVANRHSWFTCGYVCVSELLSAFDIGSGANMELALAIAAPTLAWFGFRTWDKFSKHGATD